jgi:molybdenum cofactor cytidylyltransferase
MPRALTDTRSGFWCIVLAAGGSSRLGRPKQLVRFRNRPLLLLAAELARSIAPGRVVIVLGAEALRLRRLLAQREPRAAIVKNARWMNGLASSLALGLRQLPATAGGAMILLTDQPLLDRGDLARLLRAWRRRPGVPAAAAYGGRCGVPAILPRRAFAAARALEGDVGARALLRRHEHLTCVPMPHAAVDVDTAADIATLGQSVQVAAGSAARGLAQLTQPDSPLT